MLKKFRLFFSSYHSIMLICTVQHKLAFKITNKQWIKLIVTRMLYISWYIQNQLVKMNLGDQGVSLTDKIFISKWCENLAKKRDFGQTSTSFVKLLLVSKSKLCRMKTRDRTMFFFTPCTSWFKLLRIFYKLLGTILQLYNILSFAVFRFKRDNT